MAIKRVQAVLECDGCGGEFTVDLDPADANLKSYLDLGAYVDWHTDVVGEHTLCGVCLTRVAVKLEDVEDPSYDQVHRVLQIAA